MNVNGFLLQTIEQENAFTLQAKFGILRDVCFLYFLLAKFR